MSILPTGRSGSAFRSVGYNFDGQRELIDVYARTADVLSEASQALTPLLLQAQDMLSTSTDLSIPHGLARIAEELTDERIDLRRRFEDLQAADARTAFLLSISGDRLINVELAADAIHAGWTYDEALLHHELADLLQLPRPLTTAQHERLAELELDLAQRAQRHTVGNMRGDLDSDFLTPRVGVPLRIGMPSAPAATRGRYVARRALADMADLDAIQHDEFEVFFHDNGNLTFVLPGVIDLRDPQYGLDAETQSLRDLDQGAIRSAFNTAVGHGSYGERILEWTEIMIDTGVIPQGTNAAIIGHSYGADTAFDLAADEHFNGALLQVTHAMATGYHSRPQFADLPGHTHALAVVNDRDVVVIAERVAERLTSRPSFTFERSRTDESEAAPAGSGDDRVTAVTPTGTLVEFGGGFAGLGHDTSEYGDYLEQSTEPVVVDFLEQLDSNGYTNDAVSLSIDVSAPEQTR